MSDLHGYGSMDHRHPDAVRSGSQARVPVQRAAPRTDDTFYVGVALLMLVVLLWTSSNFLTNYQLTQGYDKPFAVTYLNTSSFALYLLPFAVVVLRGRPKHGATTAKFGRVWARMGFTIPAGSIWSSNEPTAYLTLPNEDGDHHRPARGADRLSPEQEHRRLIRPSSIDGRRPISQSALPVLMEDPPLDMHQTAKLAAQFMMVWFMANYCLNVALKLTSVASATTLSSASGFFTLALGSVVGVELFSSAKLGAVTMSFIGVLMVTRADSTEAKPGPGTGIPSNEPAQPFVGDLLALASALFYAVYVVLLKVRIGREERVSMPLFFGFVGLLNILFMWPIGILLHCTGIETLGLPHGHIMWSGLVVNMAITVVSDFAYLLAMLKSSPLVATVGLSLTIPLAILGDAVRGSHSGGMQSYLGSALVLASFVVIGLVDRMVAQRLQPGPDEAIVTHAD